MALTVGHVPQAAAACCAPTQGAERRAPYFSVCSRRRRMVDRTVTEAAVLHNKREDECGQRPSSNWQAPGGEHGERQPFCQPQSPSVPTTCCCCYCLRPNAALSSMSRCCLCLVQTMLASVLPRLQPCLTSCCCCADTSQTLPKLRTMLLLAAAAAAAPVLA